MKRFMLLLVILFQFFSILTGEKIYIGSLHTMAQNQTCELDDIVVIGHQTNGDDDDYDPDDLWNEGLNICSDGSGENNEENEVTNWYNESSYNQGTGSDRYNVPEIYNESDSIQMMQNNRRRLYDLVVPKKNRTRLETRILAMKLMLIRSRYTNKEVAAAFLENGDVVIYHDKECTDSSSVYYLRSSGTGGNHKEYYHNTNNDTYYLIKDYVHTHPYYSESKNSDNPLYISKEDYAIAVSNGAIHDNINILLLNGAYYSQGTQGNALYSPNFKYNIYDK